MQEDAVNKLNLLFGKREILEIGCSLPAKGKFREFLENQESYQELMKTGVLAGAQGRN